MALVNCEKCEEEHEVTKSFNCHKCRTWNQYPKTGEELEDKPKKKGKKGWLS